MIAAMVELFCDNFDQEHPRILLDIDDTEDLQFTATSNSRCSARVRCALLPVISIYEATTGKPVAIILRLAAEKKHGGESARRALVRESAVIDLEADGIHPVRQIDIAQVEQWRGCWNRKAHDRGSQSRSVGAGGEPLVAAASGSGVGTLPAGTRYEGIWIVGCFNRNDCRVSRLG